MWGENLKDEASSSQRQVFLGEGGSYCGKEAIRESYVLYYTFLCIKNILYKTHVISIVY